MTPQPNEPNRTVALMALADLSKELRTPVNTTLSERLDEQLVTEPRPFVVAAKVQTFRRKTNTLRAAIRSEGTPAIQDAWDAFEALTDCVSMEQVNG